MTPSLSVALDAFLVESSCSFGPWKAELSDRQRIARLSELRAVVALLCGMDHPLVAELCAAVLDPAASERALQHVLRLPARRRRRVMSVLATLRSPSRRRIHHG